jgi:hypothetical protein
MIKGYINVKFTKEGTHRYPEALTDPTLNTGKWDDVSFLGHEHFHYFYFVVTVEVFQNNRDIEFIQFRRWLESLYATDGTLKIDFMSCEMLAEQLIKKIEYKYPGRYIKVEVYEDNINGGILEYFPE